MKAIRQASTANVEAYTFYLKGRQFFHNWMRHSIALARRTFAKAVELDPQYVRADPRYLALPAQIEKSASDRLAASVGSIEVPVLQAQPTS